MKLLTRFLTRYWGYLALALAILGFFTHHLGYMAILALAAVGYFLVAAPVWCCAVTRTGTLCRDNSHGLLLAATAASTGGNGASRRSPRLGAGLFSRPGNQSAGSSAWSAAWPVASRP